MAPIQPIHSDVATIGGQTNNGPSLVSASSTRGWESNRKTSVGAGWTLALPTVRTALAPNRVYGNEWRDENSIAPTSVVTVTESRRDQVSDSVLEQGDEDTPTQGSAEGYVQLPSSEECQKGFLGMISGPKLTYTRSRLSEDIPPDSKKPVVSTKDKIGFSTALCVFALASGCTIISMGRDCRRGEEDGDEGEVTGGPDIELDVLPLRTSVDETVTPTPSVLSFPLDERRPLLR